ncbi:hypothetical protein [Luethyella okanaganae]|uniref:Uncharacterized protein n=1 Tax=Luethyella okanaganae TaxID=69372 RepID=A0ABW1VCK7_9MICO
MTQPLSHYAQSPRLDDVSGCTVLDLDDDDPILVDSSGAQVDTWREVGPASRVHERGENVR